MVILADLSPINHSDDVQRLTGSMAKVRVSTPRPRSAPDAIQTRKDPDKYDPKLHDKIMYASNPQENEILFTPANLSPMESQRQHSREKLSPKLSAFGSGSRGKAYECHFCDRDYSRKDERNRYEEDKHCACQYCGKRHRNREDERSHECRCRR